MNINNNNNNNNNSAANQLVQQVSARALQLVHKYYECLDNVNTRQQWTSFYVPFSTSHPLLIWNGHILPTVADIATYAQNLPTTKHTTTTIDAHPLMGTSDFVVTVQGTVTYGDNHRRRFFQRITATKDPNSERTFITSDYMRWTGEA